MIENKTAIAFSGGIGSVVILAIVFSFFIIPIEARDNPLIIQSGGGGSSSSGVNSLTSSNSAISLNASSGNVLITPKWQLLAQNSTLEGSSSPITTLVNQNLGSVSALNCGTTATTNCAEKITATSILLGQSFNKITFGLKKVNSPTGIGTAGVFDSSNNVLLNCGTLDVSTLTTSYVSHAFTCPSIYTLSANEYIGFKVPLQSGANTVQISATTPSQYDGANTFVSQFTTGAWADATTWDLGSNTASGAWILERIGTIYIKADITANKHLLVIAELRYNASSGIIIRLNNDTGNNYAIRTDISGTTSSLTSQSHCNIINSTIIMSGDRPFLVMWIDNNQSGDRKIAVGDFGYGADTNASTAPSNIDFTCKWSNTSNQVTSILISGSITTGSIITVWGYD